MRGTMWLMALGCGIILSSSGCCGFLREGGCGSDAAEADAARKLRPLRGRLRPDLRAGSSPLPPAAYMPMTAANVAIAANVAAVAALRQLRRMRQLRKCSAVAVAASAVMTAVAASATSASIPCGGSGGYSIAAPGAAQVAEIRTGARRSAIRPIAAIRAAVTAIGPVAADAHSAITVACRKAMI